MSTIVKFENVVAVAGSFPVLTGVDISVQEGEIVLLQGKNGGRKDQLFACLRWTLTDQRWFRSSLWVRPASQSTGSAPLYRTART